MSTVRDFNSKKQKAKSTKEKMSQKSHELENHGIRNAMKINEKYVVDFIEGG
jgi:hypothetical protein